MLEEIKKHVLVLLAFVLVGGCALPELAVRDDTMPCEKVRLLAELLDSEQRRAEDAVLLGDDEIKPNSQIISEKSLLPLEYLSRLKKIRAQC